jgi:hypothetical protein
VSRLVIVLETENRQYSTARHAITQRLETVRRCLMDGVSHGVLEITAESRVSGAWLMTTGEDE